ncbi:phospho-N-acetylmuramoyl-pentapeptide-transferase [bacterium]|nr:phospho-N-acetylmuramoyl-pentapeptide-transferase [bacterium]
MEPIAINVIKVFFLTVVGSVLAVFSTPALTNFLYRHKLWRKSVRTKTIDGKEAKIFYKLHKEKEVSAPRFGGLLIWVTTLIEALFFWSLSYFFPDFFWIQKLNFLSRSQTWLPMFSLITAALVGLFDDILQVKGKGKYIAGGLTFRERFLMVSLIGLIGGLWFYFKLDWKTIHIPGNGDFFIGPFYILLFVIVMLACWSGGVIDGLDGLAGGAFASMFGAFGVIAFAQNQINLAAFCGVITGTILAFLWFNIPPARFYMGETGSLALTSTLAVVAFLTDSVLVLPVIGGLLVIESGSVILQLLSKKIRKKKIFLSAPIHQHLQARGWQEPKIVMRFWIIGVVFAIIGVAIRLLG